MNANSLVLNIENDSKFLFETSNLKHSLIKVEGKKEFLKQSVRQWNVGKEFPLVLIDGLFHSLFYKCNRDAYTIFLILEMQILALDKFFHKRYLVCHQLLLRQLCTVPILSFHKKPHYVWLVIDDI